MNDLSLLVSKDYKTFIKVAEEEKPKFDIPHEDVMNEYDVREHRVYSPSLRPNKRVERPNISEGKPVLDANNQQTFTTSFEPVARVGMAYQKLIVARRIGFLLGNPVEYRLDDFDDSKGDSFVFNATDVIVDDNKLEYRDRDLSERLFSEREIAEIWYKKEDYEFWKSKIYPVGKDLGSPARMKMMLAYPSNGDKLTPVFDNFGDMISFIRQFKGVVDTKIVDVVAIYTDTQIIGLYQLSGDWVELPDNSIQAHGYGKIPVVYYRQDNAEWYDVQSMIERREEVQSNLGDENDYFGQPILFMKGNITGMTNKKDSGKVIEGKGEDTDVRFISWEHAPESIKLEIEELDKNIYRFSQTPDISFESVKGIGAVTGIALKLMFTDPQMAARTKESIIGEGFQRRMNFLKTVVGTLIDPSLNEESKQIVIKPVFTPFLPEDLASEISTLVDGYQGGIMSRETAVEMNPFVEDTSGELDKMKNENKEQGGSETV